MVKTSLLCKKKNCLNCGTKLRDKYCSHCGQKADTHRISPKHFVLHDLLHGVFHIDKGILFTLKETFKRPGAAARDYIAGKRIRYYNIFYLILIILGLHFLLNSYINQLYPNDEFSKKIVAAGDGTNLLHFLKNNAKSIILSFIPLFALNGMLFFKKPKLNFAEHHIIAGFILLGICCLLLLRNLFNLLPPPIAEGNVLIAIKDLFDISAIAFPLYVQFSAYKKEYKLLGLYLKIIGS